VFATEWGIERGLSFADGEKVLNRSNGKPPKSRADKFKLWKDAGIEFINDEAPGSSPNTRLKKVIE